MTNFYKKTLGNILQVNLVAVCICHETLISTIFVRMNVLNKIMFLCLTWLISVVSENQKPATVETIYGKIQGRLKQTVQAPHTEYYSFLGIPYAKPPVDILRFRPPQKADAWYNETKKCENFGNYCIQISQHDGSVIGDEDCLTLNIFTKHFGDEKVQLLPVMFWVHGGQHSRGSGAEFGPDYLIEKSIVLVTINYRLSILGFMSTMDRNSHGNWGLKDQIFALEWVRDNIANFGGDPNKITIFGQSSGADSINLLQLSPRSRGLFQQMIIQSGSALNARFLQRDPLKYLNNIAEYFNISTGSTKSIVKGLRKIAATKLIKAANSSGPTGYENNLEAFPFFPVIEVENSEAIITKSPYESLEKGDFNKIPFILGYTTNEGIKGLQLIDSSTTMKITEFDSNYALFASQSFNNPTKAVNIGKTVREYFLGNDSAVTCREKLSKFLTQELFVRGIRKGVDFQRRYQNGYFYRFSYKGTVTSQYSGVAHAEEIQYLFPKYDKIEILKKADVETRKRMVELWTNFAIYGNPTPVQNMLLQNKNWKKCDEASLNFMDIGENLVTGINADVEEYNFWENMFKMYGVQPFLTY